MYTRAEQIIKNITGFSIISNIAVPVGTNSFVVNTEVAAALLADNVSVIDSGSESEEGLIINLLDNLVLVNQLPKLNKLYYLGRSVYARLTKVDGDYTITLKYLSNAGVETNYTTDNNYNITFGIPYRFSFAKFPADMNVRMMRFLWM
jgi:hypothetical protein